MIHHWRSNASESFLDLLVIHRVATLADELQLGFQPRGFCNRTTSVIRQFALIDQIVLLVLRQEGEQGFAHRSAMKRRSMNDSIRRALCVLDFHVGER